MAIYVGDASKNNDYSLVWWLRPVNNSGKVVFTWDENDYGLGWGNTSEPIDIGVQFSAGQDPTPAFPNVTGGKNVLPVSYNNAGFFSGVSYSDNNISNKLEISTAASFTVSDSQMMGLALYITKSPSIIMQGSLNNT